MKCHNLAIPILICIVQLSGSFRNWGRLHPRSCYSDDWSVFQAQKRICWNHFGVREWNWTCCDVSFHTIVHWVRLKATEAENDMQIIFHFCFRTYGWRLGLQAVTGTVFLTFFLGTFYRSASLYHPQRRAILHLKSQKRKIKNKDKEKNKAQDDRPPYFDFTTLKSRTVQILLSSIFVSSFGLLTPIFYLVSQDLSVFTEIFWLNQRVASYMHWTREGTNSFSIERKESSEFDCKL